MPCFSINFYLPEQVGILSLALHVPWPQKRGAYAPQTKSDSLIKSVGKIKIVNHAHLRELFFFIITPTCKNINTFFNLSQSFKTLMHSGRKGSNYSHSFRKIMRLKHIGFKIPIQ